MDCVQTQYLTREKSLQEILSGDCFTRTQYELKFKVGTVRETICEKTLTKDEVKKFKQAISNESEYHMYYNNVLLREKVGFVKPMGVTFNSRPSYYLVKHIHFYPQYYENQVVDISSVADLDSAVDITEDAEIRVRFTYSVFWKDSIIKPTKSITQKWKCNNETVVEFRIVFIDILVREWLNFSRSGIVVSNIS